MVLQFKKLNTLLVSRRIFGYYSCFMVQRNILKSLKRGKYNLASWNVSVTHNKFESPAPFIS